MINEKHTEDMMDDSGAQESKVNENEVNTEEFSEEKNRIQDQSLLEKGDEGNDDLAENQQEFDSIWKDKYLRLSADFDNYRRRTLKEKMDLTRMGGEKILRELLPVIDDYERGLHVVREGDVQETVIQGMDLIYLKIQDFLKHQGVSEIKALHEVFDTEFHEAITKIPAPKKEWRGKVLDVTEKGYLLHDKVIRFAKVVIGE